MSTYLAGTEVTCHRKVLLQEGLPLVISPCLRWKELVSPPKLLVVRFTQGDKLLFIIDDASWQYHHVDRGLNRNQRNFSANFLQFFLHAHFKQFGRSRTSEESMSCVKSSSNC